MIGLLVATLVTALSASAGIGACGIDVEGECAALAQTLSVRMGLVAGATAVLMLLVVAGLLHLVAIDETRRTEGPRTVWDRWE